jgi:hypothetical protein
MTTSSGVQTPDVVPSHLIWPAAQGVDVQSVGGGPSQRPFKQCIGGLQTYCAGFVLPQPPQLLLSVYGFTQLAPTTPPPPPQPPVGGGQMIKPGAHVDAPLSQTTFSVTVVPATPVHT